jgi:hypothetical protein
MKNLFPLFLLLIFFGCKKDVPDNTTPLLTKSWKMTGWIVLTPLQGTLLDGISQNWMGASACVSDKIQAFKPGGIFLHEQAVTCSNDRDYNGTWTLSDDYKTINVQYTGGGYPDFKYTIIALTNLLLKVQRQERSGVPGGEMDLLMQYEFQPQ